MPDLLERYVVRIDPVAHTIAFHNPKNFRYVGTGAGGAARFTARSFVH